MYCKNCGKKISDNARSCVKCGEPTNKLTIKPKKKSTAVILAVLLSYWTWVYTYKKDAWMFWVSAVSVFFLWWTLLVPIAIWIWAIIDTCIKNKEWYENYSY